MTKPVKKTLPRTRGPGLRLGADGKPTVESLDGIVADFREQLERTLDAALAERAPRPGDQVQMTLTLRFE